jgi:hypothetical protein
MTSGSPLITQESGKKLDERIVVGSTIAMSARRLRHLKPERPLLRSNSARQRARPGPMLRQRVSDNPSWKQVLFRYQRDDVDADR